MKRNAGRLFLAMVGILISSGAAWADESAEPRKSLRIANWSMYIDFDDNMPEDLPPEKRSPTLREFAEKFNCDIEYHEFDTFDSMLAKFTELSGFYDIMVLSCGYTRSIMALGWLLPIPEEKIPNLKIVDDSARHPPPDPDGRYLIPYLNDYVGLAFRNDILATTNLTWGEYFNPPSSWQGHVGLYDSPPVMFALAIISSGKDYPNATSADFSEAQAKIANLRNRFSPTISDDPTVLSDKLLSGELWATPLYAPDAQALLSKSTNISFLIPEDGSEYYYDYFIVNKDSQNQDLAFEFINFVLDPQILGRISAYLGAGATSEEARLVSRELATPMVPAAMTPDGKPLPRLQITYALNPEIEARWLSIMSEPVFPASGEELAD